jgi:pyridoxamine 5'-phosphate oxidase
MITIIQTKPIKPIEVFIKFYNEALNSKQKNIEAICISSYDVKSSQVESRFVNLKYIKGNQWLFFSGYNGPKSIQFDSHPQISGLFYWPSINVQIRIKATIKKAESAFSDNHFKIRDRNKNALAISSKQSQPIESYKKILENFNNINNSDLNLKKRPKYWGGYSFEPYYFEFWEGDSSRINKRSVYENNNDRWEYSIIQP